jgi:hypothetical protein
VITDKATPELLERLLGEILKDSKEMTDAGLAKSVQQTSAWEGIVQAYMNNALEDIIKGESLIEVFYTFLKVGWDLGMRVGYRLKESESSIAVNADESPASLNQYLESQSS